MEEIAEISSIKSESGEIIDKMLDEATSSIGEFNIDKFLEKIKNSDLGAFDISNEETKQKLKELIIPDNELDENGLPIIRDEDIKYIDLFSQYKSNQQKMISEMIQSIKLMLNETNEYIETDHFNSLSEEEKNKIVEFKERNILILKNVWNSIKEFKSNVKPKIDELIRDVSQKNLNELSLFILKDKIEKIEKNVTNDGELLYLLNIIFELYKTKSPNELLQEIVFNSDEYCSAIYNYSRILLKSIRGKQNEEQDLKLKQTQILLLFQNFINELFGIIYNYFNKLDNDPLSPAIFFKNSNSCNNSFFIEIIKNNEEFFKYVYDETYNKTYKLSTEAMNNIAIFIDNIMNNTHLTRKKKNQNNEIIKANMKATIDKNIKHLFVDTVDETIAENNIYNIRFKTFVPFIMTRISTDLLFKYIWDFSNYLYDSGNESHDSPVYYLITLITHQFALLTSDYNNKEIINSINLNMYHEINMDTYLVHFFNYFKELFIVAKNIEDEILRIN